MSSRDMRGLTTQRRLSSRQPSQSARPRSQQTSNRASKKQTAPTEDYSSDDVDQNPTNSRRTNSKKNMTSSTKWQATVRRETAPGPISVETIHFYPEPNFSDPLWLYPKTLLLTVFVAALMMGLLGRKYIAPHFSLVWLLPGAPTPPANIPIFGAGQGATGGYEAVPQPIDIDEPFDTLYEGLEFAPGAGFGGPLSTEATTTESSESGNYFKFSNDDSLISTAIATAITTATTATTAYNTPLENWRGRAGWR